MRWWCSWVLSEEAWEATEPAAPVLGVWCSGLTAHEPPRATVCAWIEAADEAEVRRIVEQRWPEFVGQEWRIEPRPMPDPPSDRFPVRR